MTHLKEGDQAPYFECNDETGKLVTSEQLKGKKVILFFYPQDNTPTCTKEACNLRDNYKMFTDKGILIYGVSPDSERKHVNFIKKFNLPYPLLADTEKKMINDFGIWGPKKFMGRLFDGLHRTTFVIDEEGNIAHIIEDVKSKEHAAQIAELMGI